MTHIHPRSLTYFFLAIFISTANLFADPATDEQVANFRTAVTTAEQEQSAAKSAYDEQLAKGKPFRDKVTELRTEIAKATAGLRSAEKDLPPKTEAAKKAVADRDAQQAVVNQAAEAAKAAVGTDKAAETEKAHKDAEAKLAELNKAVETSAAMQKELEDAIAKYKETLTKAPEDIKVQEAELAKLKPADDETQQKLAVATSTRVEKQQALEGALATRGEFVSFSKEIAPVFAKRCLACHNARVAKGRYNMESFAGIVKGGEVGDTVISGKPDDSHLVTVIVDGSMPQDADPLTESQIASVEKWISLGAVLDAGLSPDAPLSSIMPKLPQPPAPEKYRVAIPVTAVAISPDGNLVASSGYHEVLLWNAANGELIRRISNVAERTYALQFSPDGKLLAVAAGTPGEYGEMKLFDPATGQLVKDPLSSSDSVYCVAFSPDGTRVATGGADRSIRIFGVASGQQERLIEDHADWVMGIAWSPDGKKLASASRDKTSKVFDAATGESQVTFSAHGDAVFGVQFTPNGEQIITSGRDKQIRIWNVANAQQAKAIGGFGNEVYGLQLTGDGRLFSASADMQVREHKLDGTEVRKMSGHTDWVYSLAFHPAGNKIVSGSWDGEVRLWNAADGQMLLKFVAAPGIAVAGK